MITTILIGLLKPVVVSVISGVSAGFITSLKKTVKADRPEQIDIVKLSRTGGTAVIIGILAYLQGFEITGENYEQYAATNAATVMLVESAWTFVKRAFAKWKANRQPK